MFERFTARARKVLVLAQEEARALGHGFIGTEHLVIGMLHEEEGLAGQALRNLGFALEPVRDKVRELVPPFDDVVPDRPPFTPRAKRTLELALREALDLGHNYIGTEHLLLGVVREGEGVGAQLITAGGSSAQAVRAEVMRLLRGFNASGFGPAPGGLLVGKGDHTPAVERLIPGAERRAEGGAVGSHHLLLATLEDEHSAASRILASFGVTLEAVAKRLEELGVEGTTDEMPKVEPYSVETVRDTVMIRVKDAELAEKVRNGELVVSFEKVEPDEAGEGT